MKNLKEAFKKMGEAHAHMKQHMEDHGIQPDAEASEDGDAAVSAGENDMEHITKSPEKEMGYKGSKLPMKHKGMF